MAALSSQQFLLVTYREPQKAFLHLLILICLQLKIILPKGHILGWCISIPLRVQLQRAPPDVGVQGPLTPIPWSVVRS